MKIVAIETGTRVISIRTNNYSGEYHFNRKACFAKLEIGWGYLFVCFTSSSPLQPNPCIHKIKKNPMLLGCSTRCVHFTVCSARRSTRHLSDVFSSLVGDVFLSLLGTCC